MFAGAPDRIRTCDPQIRNLVLYPTELRALTQMQAHYVGAFGLIQDVKFTVRREGYSAARERPSGR